MPTHAFDDYREIIPDYKDFVESLKSPLPVHFRVNRLKTEPPFLKRSLERSGIEVKRAVEGYENFFIADGKNLPGKLPEYFMGHVHPQALSSCLCCLALAPAKGSLVLDMCAAPGGKSAYMAELMQNTGTIIANELYPSRQIPLGHTLDRLGVLNTLVSGYQAQQFPKKKRFDYILVDVPCSGEGRYRGSDLSPAFRREKKIDSLIKLQKNIVLRGFDLLEYGGEMLYATCTYSPEENESVVDLLLKESGEADLLPISLGVDVEPGILEWKGGVYDPRIRRCARFYPHRVDSVGFFMARISRKRGEV